MHGVPGRQVSSVHSAGKERGRASRAAHVKCRSSGIRAWYCAASELRKETAHQVSVAAQALVAYCGVLVRDRSNAMRFGPRNLLLRLALAARKDAGGAMVHL